MLKDLEVHLDINSEKRELITTSAIFYSRDKNTSKILIHITRKNKEIALSPEAKVYVLMLFDEGRETKKHLYTANFEEKSIYSIVLPEKVLGHEGVVTAGVYIDYQNEQSADVGYFSFHMKRSMLDDDFPELDTVYVSEFEKALNEIKEKSTEFDDEAQRLTEKIIAIENKIDSNQVVKKDDFDTKVEQVENDIKDNAKQIDELSINHLNDNKKLNNEIMRMSRPAENTVKYIAHRGNHAQYPENSLGAFDSVRSHWGIETDTQITKDGHWVIMHDATVDRTTNGTGRVDSMTLEEIKKLTLKFPEWEKDKIPANYDKVPTFKEYLMICKKKSKVPVIEIKKGSYSSKNFDDLATIVQENIAIDKIVFISFDYDVLLEIRKRLKNAFVLFLTSVVDSELIDRVYDDFKFRCGVNQHYSNASVTRENISYAHSKNMLYGVWTVPESQFEKMTDLDVDLITTDSQSSYLKVGKVNLKNGFEEQSNYLDTNTVIQNDNGTVTLRLNLKGGKNDNTVVIGTLPEWAIPVKSAWGMCSIRTSQGASFATADIHGRLSTAKGEERNAGNITTGLNWSDRITWVNIAITYDLY